MRIILAILLFGVTAQAERPSLCSGKKLSATFAVNQKAQKGVPLDRLNKVNTEYRVATDYLIQNYFKLKVRTKGELVSGKLTYQPLHIKQVSDNPLKYEITREKDTDPKHNPSIDIVQTMWKVDGSLTLHFEPKETAQPDVYQFFKDNYLTSGDTEQVLENITTIQKKVDGDWIIQEVSIDENELCKNARPRSDLVSN